MKKKAIIFLTAALLFSMTACGNKKDDNKGETLPSGDTTENDSTYEESSTDYGAGVDIQDIKKALTDEFGDNYWPDTEISKEMLKDIYGVSEDLYEEYYGESPMISTNVDTVLVIKAKEDQVAAVEEALNEYRSRLVNDTMQYPMNIGKIQVNQRRYVDQICNALNTLLQYLVRLLKSLRHRSTSVNYFKQFIVRDNNQCIHALFQLFNP